MITAKYAPFHILLTHWHNLFTKPPAISEHLQNARVFDPCSSDDLGFAHTFTHPTRHGIMLIKEGFCCSITWSNSFQARSVAAKEISCAPCEKAPAVQFCFSDPRFLFCFFKYFLVACRLEQHKCAPTKKNIDSHVTSPPQTYHQTCWNTLKPTTIK